MHNSEVAHHFIYESSEAKGSNFSCRYNSIYSFGSLMATICREKKIILVDQRISYYSTSSCKHRSNLMKALPSYYSVFEWRWDDGSFIATQYDVILNLIDKQSRARVYDYSNQVARLIDLCNEYVELFKENVSAEDHILLSEINTINIQELLSSSQHLIEANKARILAMKTKEDEKRQEARQNNLDKFLEHSNVVYDPNYNSVYLKVVDDTLFTSNSVRVPLKDAIMLYKAYLAGKNILNAKLSHYTVVKSSKTSVTIGCTTISAIELNRVLSEYLQKDNT